MKKLLITGFDPFGGEPVNPAYEAVRLLPDVVAGIKLCKLEVPTEFVCSGAVLRDALAAERPDAVLCVGAKVAHAGHLYYNVGVDARHRPGSFAAAAHVRG